METGHAYSIVGKARWKMVHDAIVPPECPGINGLDEAMAGAIARVADVVSSFRAGLRFPGRS